MYFSITFRREQPTLDFSPFCILIGIGMQFEIGSFLFRKSLAKISIRKKILRFMNYVFGGFAACREIKYADVLSLHCKNSRNSNSLFIVQQFLDYHIRCLCKYEFGFFKILYPPKVYCIERTQKSPILSKSFFFQSHLLCQIFFSFFESQSTKTLSQCRMPLMAIQNLTQTLTYRPLKLSWSV